MLSPRVGLEVHVSEWSDSLYDWHISKVDRPLLRDMAEHSQFSDCTTFNKYRGYWIPLIQEGLKLYSCRLHKSNALSGRVRRHWQLIVFDHLIAFISKTHPTSVWDMKIPLWPHRSFWPSFRTWTQFFSPLLPSFLHPPPLWSDRILHTIYNIAICGL